MENKKNDIKQQLRQSISWSKITKSNWGRLNALQAHCITRRDRAKNVNIDFAKSKKNINNIFVPLAESKKKIKAAKILGGLQSRSASHMEFVIHAGNKYNSLNEEDSRKYFEAVLAFLKKELAGVCLFQSIHYDETTPHMHLLFENLVETKKGNYCSTRALFGLLNQKPKDDHEFFKKFVRKLHMEVSQSFGFLEPREGQKAYSLQEYKEREEEALKEGIEALKIDKEDTEKELLKQQQEQQQQEEQLKTLRAHKNNLTIEGTRIENLQKKSIEQVKKLQNLEHELKELREKELQEIEQLRTTKTQKKELLKQQQDQELQQLKNQQEQQLRNLKQKQEQQLKTQQEEQQLKEQELQEQEQQLRQQEQALRKQKEENLRRWEKQKSNYKENFEKLKAHWDQQEQQAKKTATKKINEIIERLLSENNLDKMLEKEIKLLNNITIKLEEATTKEQKMELIEKIMKAKKSRIVRLRNSRDKNKTEVIEEIKKEQQQIKKAKRELSR